MTVKQVLVLSICYRFVREVGKAQRQNLHSGTRSPYAFRYRENNACVATADHEGVEASVADHSPRLETKNPILIVVPRRLCDCDSVKATTA
jgi:hypothetical protein